VRVQVPAAGGGSVEAAEGVARHLAAHGDVQDDEEAVVGGCVPRAGVDVDAALGTPYLAPVHVPGGRLVGCRPVQRVEVEALVARGRRTAAGAAVADAALLVARAAGRGTAVLGLPGAVGAVDTLHDVELADTGPVPQVA